MVQRREPIGSQLNQLPLHDYGSRLRPILHLQLGEDVA
jgi:hypothetical protein